MKFAFGESVVNVKSLDNDEPKVSRKIDEITLGTIFLGSEQPNSEIRLWMRRCEKVSGSVIAFSLSGNVGYLGSEDRVYNYEPVDVEISYKKKRK